MTYQGRETHSHNGGQHHAGVGEILGSMVGLGAAATKFTISQMETALYMVSSPTRAMDRMRNSIENFAEAMNRPVDASETREERPSTSYARHSGETEAEPADETLAGRKA
jgi:hypothetical protein